MKHALHIAPLEQLNPENFSIFDLFSTVWRGKWLIALATTIAVLAGGFYAFKVATPMYRSTAVIALEAQEQQLIADIESVLTGASSDTTSLNTETIVLQSRNLLGRVVDDLDLVSDPEFNSQLRPKSPFSVGAIIALITGPSTGPAPTETDIRNAVIDQLINRLKITNTRQSLVFEIRSETTSPTKSALISNTLAESYIDDQLRVKIDANERATAVLSERAAGLRQTLEQLENQYNTRSDSAQFVNTEVLAAQSRQLKELRERVAAQAEATADVQVRLRSLQTLADARDYAGFASLADDRIVSRMFEAYSNGTADAAAMQTAIAAMLDRLSTELDRNRQQTDILTRSQADLSRALTQQSAEQIELAQLEREVEATRLLYESFLTRLKETNVQQGLQKADSRILSEAVPRPASSPRVLMVLAVSMLLGLIVGTIIVLLNEMRQTAFRTADQLRARTGKTVFGSIPVIPSRHRRDALKYLREKPSSVVAEAVRNLRTSILMSQADRAPQVIMVTSSVPGEGKTTVSLSMAQNMASLGQRVLLIEGDIRRRTFNQYFSAQSGHDLMTAMKDPTSITPGTLREGDLGVDVLVGIKTGMNAADVFSSRQFADLLAHMRTMYDHIIIDTPPVLVVPDARVIAPYTDARVYVVYWNKTTATQVTQGLEMLDSVGYSVSGMVLTQVDSRKMRSYGYGGEYGYDGHQSKYYDS